MKLSPPQMAQLLMQVGDVVPFNRPQRGEVPGIPFKGPMAGRTGGGDVVPMTRPRSGQQKYDDALARQTGAPRELTGGPWPIGPQPNIPKHWDWHHVQNMKTKMMQSPDVKMLRQMWGTPQMARALQKLSPAELNAIQAKLFPK